MAEVIASNIKWGSAPSIYFNFSYDHDRVGTTQRYNITIECKPLTGASYFGYPINVQIKAAGTQIVNKTMKGASPTQWSSSITLTTGWFGVQNKTDGTTPLTIRIYSGSGSSRDTTYSYSLKVDPAPSKISATDAYIESASTVLFDRMSSAYTHSLAYKPSHWNTYTTIFEKRDITSYGWHVPSSLYELIPAAPSMSITLQCKTYNGNTLVGTTECDMLAIALQDKCDPTITVTAADSNSATIALTGNNKRIIKGHSTINATATAKARNSAYMVSTKITQGSHISAETAPDQATLTIGYAESVDVMATAIDSRGFRVHAMPDLTLVPYVELTANTTVQRIDPTGDSVRVMTKGNYFNGNFGAVANTLSLQVQYKPATRTAWESTDTWTTMTVSISGNTYTADATLAGLDYQQAYNIRVRAQDKIHTGAQAIYSYITISKGIPVFDWGENDFRFNVPVNMAAGGVGALTIQNQNVTGDVLSFALNCESGLTPFSTNPGVTSLPGADYTYSVGIVHKRTSSLIAVYLKNYKSNSIAVNTYNSGWTGWTIK